MSTSYATAHKLSRHRPAFNPPYMTGEVEAGPIASETILPLQPQHIASCAALFVEVFANRHRPWTRPTARAFLTRLLSEADAQGFVLWDALGRPMAFAIGSRECCAGEAATHPGSPTHFDLRELCVRGELHGRGCGTRLLAHIERELQATHIAFNAGHSSSRIAKMARML